MKYFEATTSLRVVKSRGVWQSADRKSGGSDGAPAGTILRIEQLFKTWDGEYIGEVWRELPSVDP